MDYIFRKDIPIYTQLVEKMIEEIISGKLKPNEKVDSVRDFAQKAGVNPNTVQRAFSELENKHLIVTNRTSGRMVCKDNDLIEKQKREYLENKTREYLDSMSKINVEEKDIIETIKKMIGDK